MKLFLEDGTAFEGESFGANPPAGGESFGEAVFATGMTGYVESLTDPSFAGQILVCTYPLIGNYGVPSPDTFESSKIHVAGLVVSEYSEEYSHADAKQSLASWLKSQGVPALSGVDTRAITKKLRERGVMLAKLADKEPRHYEDPNRENLVAKVSPRDIEIYGNGPLKITFVDCGAKENIVRSLLRPEITLKRVPWDYDFTDDEYHALILSNGPGDPQMCVPTIHHIGLAMRRDKPILGVCLGNQLLALAAGGSTYKLKYGHRSHNQPCVDKIGRSTSLETTKDRCYITSQNHGFAVDAASLGSAWDVWFENANDGSVEGIRHTSKPWRSVQFHPEAAPGPTDTAWIFDEFLAELPKRIRI